VVHLLLGGSKEEAMTILFWVSGSVAYFMLWWIYFVTEEE
jgi:hypothetical protein